MFSIWMEVIQEFGIVGGAGCSAPGPAIGRKPDEPKPVEFGSSGMADTWGAINSSDTPYRKRQALWESLPALGMVIQHGFDATSARLDRWERWTRVVLVPQARGRPRTTRVYRRRVPLKLSPQTSERQAYCPRCRDRRPMIDRAPVVFRNGRNAVQGTCETCGAIISRIVHGPD